MEEEYARCQAGEPSGHRSGREEIEEEEEQPEEEDEKTVIAEDSELEEEATKADEEADRDDEREIDEEEETEEEECEKGGFDETDCDPAGSFGVKGREGGRADGGAIEIAENPERKAEEDEDVEEVEEEDKERVATEGEGEGKGDIADFVNSSTVSHGCASLPSSRREAEHGGIS